MKGKAKPLPKNTTIMPRRRHLFSTENGSIHPSGRSQLFMRFIREGYVRAEIKFIRSMCSYMGEETLGLRELEVEGE
ncbi:hypothetical protein EYF80_036765 [Liparis tanakae]|uniref:Uncharacterized protein n=1 Tax=Liparis tanakae TaxID=230148 RepID=A0A4Z2GJN6_9TELE|nr:hypothetical protein EYF80_036765 [Liparis tanakae]